MVNLMNFINFICVSCSVLVLASCASPPPVSQGPKPQQLVWIAPPYPATALKHRWKGTVTVSYDVDVNGDVHNPVVVFNTATQEFEKGAIAAVSKWKFENNKPYRGMIAKISYRISNKL